MRLTEIQLLHLHQCLEQRQFLRRKTVVLIQVNQPELRQFLFAARLPRQLKTVRVIISQPVGHQQLTKSRFTLSLHTAHQHRGHCIGATVHASCPLGGHSQHPAVEAVYPEGFFRDALRQRSDAIHSVPLGQCIHISKERVIVFQAFRMEQAAHILIPAIDAMTVRFQAQGVQGTLSHHLIKCVRPLPLRAIFGLFRQHVETELIVFPQVVLQTVLHLPVIRSLFFFPFIRRRVRLFRRCSFTVP